MRRSLASSVLTVLLVALASITTAHSAQKVARIGVLCVTTCTTASMNAFWDELHKLGWMDGVNIVIDRREAFGRGDQLSSSAFELAQSKTDVIVAVAPQAARAAANATSKIPIVFAAVADPSAWGSRRTLVTRIGT